MCGGSSSSYFPEMRAAAIVVAGGSGRRMGGAGKGQRKQYLELEGQAVLLWAILPFLRHPAVGPVIVVVPEADLDQPPAWLADHPVTLVAGGPERSDSVWNGLLSVPADAEVVLIHDGARPFVSAALIDRVLAAASTTATVPAIPATDTIKVANAEGFVSRTPDRSALWHAQTPQGFPRALLVGAYEHAMRAGWSLTDEAAVCERAGIPVRLVPGSEDNLKITRAFDLEIAGLVARRLRAEGLGAAAGE
jgi:2-C-methyl-D-erythritol 4-phosphate cytidylyltransferase